MGMGEFEKRRESREHLKASNLAGNNGTTLDLGGNLLPGPGHGLNVRTGMCRNAILSLGPAAVPGTRTGPAQKRSCGRGVTSARMILTI